jgi:hypothetical protein
MDENRHFLFLALECHKYKDIQVIDHVLKYLAHFYFAVQFTDRLCGLVVRVPGYRSRGAGSIPGATRFSEKY